MQICNQCSRVNPADASYCYHDGSLLAGHKGAGPINAGAAPFPSPFVFPTGDNCRNFDQLAMTCQQQWKAAVELVKQGYLGQFFGGLGRADLAMAAQEAARFPDQDRGLDQLLAKLPTNVLQAPKVKAEPTEINLGQVPMGTDRASEIHLSNMGMRLVYGSVVSDSKWLTLGEAPGNPQKLFQFGAEATIPVQIRGKDLKAGTKQLIGRLTVESNGGTCVVTVKADVPITPFTEGTLAGALTPRQIAEKAKANPKEAAPLFEKGVVGQWYAQNGWTYPVQGPNASGLGAVQQFFEALGLAKAPKVEVKTKAVTLRGDGGQALQAVIDVGSPEKKPVFAHAVCDQPWVDVSKVKMSGNSAAITVSIPSVPNRPGEKLEARITVTGNGNQRTVVPLTLDVGAANPFGDLAMPPPMPWSSGPPPLPGAAAPLVLAPVNEVPMLVQAVTGNPGAVVMPMPNQAATAGPPPLLPTLSSPTLAPSSGEGIALGRRKPIWVHLLPLGVLALILFVILILDLVVPGPTAGAADAADIDRNPRLAVFFDWKADVKEKDLGKEKGLGDSLSWGLVARESQNQESKRLTFHHRGKSNQAMVMIDGKPRVIGNNDEGKWDGKPTDLIPRRGEALFGLLAKTGKSATWVFNEQIAVTQHVEIIPGEPVEVVPNEFKRLIDTCLVRYKIHNKDPQKAHNVGLRFMLDTFIGENDGVPFLLPGDKALIDTKKEFKTPSEVPDFIQAYEYNDLKKPGTIAQLNLRPDVKKFEAPGRVSLTNWPGYFFPQWEVPVENMGLDSAIVMYWQPEDLAPGKSRDKELAFTYGLGSVSFEGGKLGLTANGNTVVGGEMTVVALVADPKPGQSVTLELHPSLKLLPGHDKTQVVPAAQQGPDGKIRPSPVTWRIKSTEASPKNRGFTITVTTSDVPALSQTRVIRIKSSSIF